MCWVALPPPIPPGLEVTSGNRTLDLLHRSILALKENKLSKFFTLRGYWLKNNAVTIPASAGSDVEVSTDRTDTVSKTCAVVKNVQAPLPDVSTSCRECNCCWRHFVRQERTGTRVSLSRARSFLRPLLPSACYAGYKYKIVYLSDCLMVTRSLV